MKFVGKCESALVADVEEIWSPTKDSYKGIQILKEFNFKIFAHSAKLPRAKFF